MIKTYCKFKNIIRKHIAIENDEPILKIVKKNALMVFIGLLVVTFYAFALSFAFEGAIFFGNIFMLAGTALIGVFHKNLYLDDCAFVVGLSLMVYNALTMFVYFIVTIGGSFELSEIIFRLIYVLFGVIIIMTAFQLENRPLAEKKLD